VTRWFAAAAAALVIALGGEPQSDELARHRALGKAFYENPTTHRQAVDEFRKALALAPNSARERINYGLALLRAGRTAEGIAELERAQRQDPSIPHSWFVLGVELKKAGDYRRATLQFERLVRLVPDEPISHFNLGYLYRLAGRISDARAEFARAAALDPGFAAPHFQLSNLDRDAGRSDAAAREQAEFLRLKREQADGSVREDVDWSRYAEVLDPADPRDAEDASPPAMLAFRDTRLATGLEPDTAGVLVLDADGDGRPDAIAWSRAGARLFRNGETLVEHSGLESFKGVRAVAAGDYDNDGLPDLCIVTDEGAAVLANRAGVFVRAPVSLPAGRFEAAAWIDYDHDYDLDLLLLGASSVLLRNNGRAGFSDQTRDLPLAGGHALAAVVLNVIPDQPGHDFVVSYADHAGILYRDRLAAGYEPLPIDAVAAGTRQLAAEDLDADGAVDLIAAGPNGVTVLGNRGGRFAPAGAFGGTSQVTPADLENRGLMDLAGSGAVLRNGGGSKFARTPAPILNGLAAAAAADFDADGRTDLLGVIADGSLHLLRNETVTRHHWIRIGLTGVKNLVLAPEAQIEVKAGPRYEKRRYAGVPMTFGLRDRSTVDVVRITWPNGLIQNETRPRADAAISYKEAPRLSGSCPMIFTWNGRGFQFVTDVLGVAPLGASAGNGTFFPVDDHEYVRIPHGALVRQGDGYDVRVTEELREVSYLDRVQLVAVDHPAAVEVFANDKFKAPPFPEFRLFGVTRRIYPSRARQGGGDVRAALLAADGVYAENFRRDYAGVAEPHDLELDFGDGAPDNRALLVLTGWVDWADGSTFRGAAQEDSRGLITPYLQVKDADGRWTTVIGDMGMPAGKPKTIVVDLTGKFRSASRQVRIVTNLCVYWDEIFLSADPSPPHVRLTPIDPSAGAIRFRGFSRATIDPERRRPEAFEYADVAFASMWNPTPGLYTRYGDVTPLVIGTDDRFVVMGSGDELQLRFSAAGLPALSPGWTRDFLLRVDGWAKDADANTAFSQSVEPLPFHAMTAYPYPPSERYPEDESHRAYRDTYNTRPALRLIRPLHAQ